MIYTFLTHLNAKHAIALKQINSEINSCMLPHTDMEKLTSPIALL